MPRPTHLDYVAVAGGGPLPGTPNVPEGLRPWCVGSPPQGERTYFNNGMFYNNSKTRITDCPDGTTNTYMVGETWYMRMNGDFAVANNNYPSWASAIDPLGAVNASYQTLVSATRAINDPAGVIGDGFNQSAFFMSTFASRHSGGANFCMGDGSVHFISQNLDLNVHRALGSRLDGIPVGNWK
jgi:prepilin-type processing-associated H-X9-DG protein